jgi:hypothetical protein
MFSNSGAGARSSYDRRATAPGSRFQSTSLPTWVISPIESSSATNARRSGRCFTVFLGRSRPAGQVGDLDAEQVQRAGGGVLDDLGDGGGTEVPGRHRALTIAPDSVAAVIAPQVAERQGCLAHHQHQRAALLERDVRRTVSRLSPSEYAMADSERTEQGATIIPQVRNDPEAIAAPTSAGR